MHIHGVSYFSSDSGLAKSARFAMERFEAMGHQISVTNLTMGDARSSRNGNWEPLKREAKRSRKTIDFIHVNPGEFSTSIAIDGPEVLSRRNAFMVCMPYCELPRVPLRWVRRLNALDAVLAPTAFIGAALRDSGVTTPIIDMPVGIDLPPADVLPDRARFGMPEGRFVFMSGMDLSSGTRRKNPEAPVEAFLKAFGPEDEHVHLVVKVNNPELTDETKRKWVQLQEKTAAYPNIQLIREAIPEEELNTFFASCDACVSLHRSEGLGLVPLEMMALGKPVITTDWSGNMDYCTPENAMLVPHVQIPVDDNHPVYIETLEDFPDVTWADPDINAAAVRMKALAQDPARAAALGKAGRRAVEARRQADWSGAMAELTKIRASWRGTTDAQRRERESWKQQHPTRLELLKRAYYEAKLELRHRLSGK